MRHRLYAMLPAGSFRLAAIKLTLTAVCLTGFLAGEQIGHVWTQRPGLAASVASGLLWNPLAPPRVSAHPAAHKTRQPAAPSSALTQESSARHTRPAKSHGKAKSKHGEKKPKHDHAGKKHGKHDAKQPGRSGDNHHH